MFIYFLFVLPVVVPTIDDRRGPPDYPAVSTIKRATQRRHIKCVVCRVTPMGTPGCMLLASGIYIGGGLIGLILLIVIIVLILR
jgi:hypothetical protein